MENEKIETKKVQANTPNHKKDYGLYIIMAAVVIMAIVAITYPYVIQDSPTISIDQATTICIAENSVFYGTEWCGYCQTQKEMFGTNAELLNYIDCDEDRDACVAAEIVGFPTWDIKGERYVGLQSLEKLKEATGC